MDAGDSVLIRGTQIHRDYIICSVVWSSLVVLTLPIVLIGFKRAVDRYKNSRGMVYVAHCGRKSLVNVFQTAGERVLILTAYADSLVKRAGWNWLNRKYQGHSIVPETFSEHGKEYN